MKIKIVGISMLIMNEIIKINRLLINIYIHIYLYYLFIKIK